MIEIGSIVDGKYKILNEIGHGGMSVVYLAMNERANKQWAIKELRKDGVQDYEVVKQNLIAETDMLKRFNHPNLPSIIDVIDNDDTFLIVMDYIEGISLEKALKRNGAQRQEDVIEWAKQLCDVLGYLHSRRPPIIYRDMKPSNVMLKPDGNVMLIDFGTAREFKESKVEDTKCLGTQGYAAPEQYGGQGQTDARTDIYCLGATMYHLVTGHNPCMPPYDMYPIRQWDPKLSSGLEEIILKCTQKNPNDRYQSCAELLYALDHYTDLDIENKKVQSFKWNTFLAVSILTVVMLVLTIGFNIVLKMQTANTYESYIQQAVECTRNDEQEELKEKAKIYRKAIDLDASRPEAYLNFMQYCLGDLDDSGTYREQLDQMDLPEKQGEPYLTIKEKELIVELLKEKGYQLKEAYPEYYADLVIYPLAKSLFFAPQSTSVSEIDGRTASVAYFKEVEALPGIKQNRQRAEMMRRFAESYKNTKNIKNYGVDGYESKGGYQDYWNDLVKLADDIPSRENPKLALMVYRMVLNVMYGELDQFSDEVEQETYSNTVQKIYDYAKESIKKVEEDTKDKTDNTRYQEAKKIYDNVKSTYHDLYGERSGIWKAYNKKQNADNTDENE